MAVLTDMRTRLASARRSRALGFLPPVALALDLIITSAALALGVIGRERWTTFVLEPAEVSYRMIVVVPLMLLLWLSCVYFVGGYRPDVFGAGPDQYKRVFNASVLAAGLVGVAAFLANFPLSRGFFVLAFLFGIPALLAGRYTLRKALHHLRMHGSLTQTVLLVGSTAHIDEIAAVLRRESWLGYRILGALTPPTDAREETPAGIPVLGDPAEIIPVVRQTEADVIFFAGGGVETGQKLRHVVWELEQDAVQVIVAPSVTDVSRERVRVRPVGGLPLMHIDPPTWANATRLGKRLFDVGFSALLLVLLSPLFLLCALAVKVADRGPVFFSQTRVGRNGTEFTCFKFRSMVVGAEDELRALLEAQGFVHGLFKMKDDPRVTRPGRWMRRLSIDELPQLFNVLSGAMSLVGPRPPLPCEVEQYADDDTRRLHVRPGLTGLWQVSGRSDLSWDDAIRLDLYYVDNWSMLQDLNILTKTVSAVLRSRGAY